MEHEAQEGARNRQADGTASNASNDRISVFNAVVLNKGESDAAPQLHYPTPQL
jgi:hypothetical protein